MKNVLLYRVDDPSRPGNRLEGSRFILRTVDPEAAGRVQRALQSHAAHELAFLRLPTAVGIGLIFFLTYKLWERIVLAYPQIPFLLGWLISAVVLSAVFVAVYRKTAKGLLRRGKKNRQLAEACNEAFQARKESLNIPEDATPFPVYFLPAHGRGKERVAGDVKYDFHTVDGYLFEEDGNICMGLTREVLGFSPEIFRGISLRKQVRFVYARADGKYGAENPSLLSSEQHIGRRVEEYACVTLYDGEDWELFLPLSSAEILAKRVNLPFEPSREA